MRFSVQLRNAVVFALALVHAPGPAAAQPSPENSVIPNCVMVLPGLADYYAAPVPVPSGTQPFSVVLRDYAGYAMPNMLVELDFTEATDVRLADTQAPGMIIDCDHKVVAAYTDATGQVTMVVRGAGINSVPGTLPAALVKPVAVNVQGFTLKNISAAVCDMNGAGTAGTVTLGLDAGDQSFIRYDVFNFSDPLILVATRSDFSCNGALDAGDLAVWRNFFFWDATSVAPVTMTFCP